MSLVRFVWDKDYLGSPDQKFIKSVTRRVQRLNDVLIDCYSLKEFGKY